MTLINETFLRHEGSTDVITFDYAEKVVQASRLRKKSLKRESRRRDACATLHGEIFICVDEAVSQAKEFKTTGSRKSSATSSMAFCICSATTIFRPQPAAR
jgi:ssRNA-specific RNase YbeY (16S rRNA maturation enzyme)